VSCIVYGCYLAGLVSLGWVLVGIHIVVYVIVPIAAVVAGIKYGTQKKDFWV
jgi:hypothetical protein